MSNVVLERPRGKRPEPPSGQGPRSYEYNDGHEHIRGYGKTGERCVLCGHGNTPAAEPRGVLVLR